MNGFLPFFIDFYRKGRNNEIVSRIRFFMCQDQAHKKRFFESFCYGNTHFYVLRITHL